MLSFIVRDADWGALELRERESALRDEGDVLVIEQKLDFGHGALVADIAFRITATVIEVESCLTCIHPVVSRRACFVALHPFVAEDQPLTIEDEAGAGQQGIFPGAISPDVVIGGMRVIEYDRHSAHIRMVFEPSAYEMEDQRNWGDASFKSYTPPIADSHPVAVEPGEIREQRIEIRLSDAAPSPSVRVGNGDRALRIPEMSILLDRESLPSDDEIAVLDRLRPARFVLRADCGEVVGLLPRALAIPDAGARLDLELIASGGVLRGARIAAEACARCGVSPDHVTLLPEPYLQSYQPIGPWPEGPSLDDAIAAGRAAFPGAAIGGGVFTNFAEFNRATFSVGACDFITHGGTPLVHAADDEAVIETLAGFGHIARNARMRGGDRPYRVGLLSIGMWNNPYGAAVAENPDFGRVAMAGHDPRQRGLFGAAWALGAIVSLLPAEPQSVGLGCAVGRLGLLHRLGEKPLWLDGTATIHPLFHVVRALAAMAGREARVLHQVPKGWLGLDAEGRTIVANLTMDAAEIEFGGRRSMRVLGYDSFAEAVRDADWLTASVSRMADRVALRPFEVAFVD